MRSSNRRKDKIMIMQMGQRFEMDRLSKRRELLRRKLKKHFSLPIQDRSYSDFEAVVDELDAVRKMIHQLKIPQR
jgi:hypothetical protein